MISSHGRIASFIIVVLSFGFLLSLTGASAFDVGALNVSNESNDTNTTTPVVDTTIGWRAESVDGYAQHSNNTQYNFSVKQGSNWGDGTRYCVGSNCLIYQPSDMSYRNSVGSQDYLSNILAVNVVVENDTATYPLAFPNTDVTYTLGSSQVKELFVLQSLPRVPAGWLGSTENVSLDFGGYIKYGSLSLRVNGEAMPLEFTTNQRIDFVDENGTTVFYLPAPVAYDSDGDTVSIEYEVEDRSGEVWFYVRTPYSWLANASRSYPVMIDPTVSVPTFEGSTGLVAYYNFENEDTIGTTLYDAWGTRNPTLYNAPTTNVTGVLGEAYSFTPNDYLEGPRIDLSGGLLTISAWVYHDALSTTNPLFSQRDNPSNNDFQISSSTDRTEASWLIWGSAPNTYTSGTGFFTSGGWNHYVFTYNGSHGRFYRNGTFFGEDVHVNTISNDAATEFRIGNDHYTNYFGGDIDEVAIYNTILSDEEISALYNDGAGARPFSLKTNLESYYTFDNATTSGTTLYDHWRSTDATLVNTPTTGASGIIGDAYDFDRASLEYLQTSRTLTDTSYTVSAWARPTTVGVANDIHVIWSTEDVTEGAGYSLEFYNNAGTYVIGHFTHDGGTSSQFLSGGSYTANEWYHVVVTVDGTTRKLYVDGVLLTNDVLGGVTEHSVQPVRIGQMGNDPVATYPRYFPGKLDELLYYTRAISGQEVADLYADQSNDTRPWSGYEFLANDAVAAWTLDDAQTNGTTHSDLAGTRDLTIDGATSASTGIVGEAFNFDGTDDRAYVVDDFTDVFENQDHTMSVWVKADTLTGGHTVWDSSDGDTVGEWNRLAWDTASNWWQASWDDGSTVRFIRDSRTANTSQWYHIVTVHTEGAVGYELFIDGVSYGTSSGHGGSAETASTLTLGLYPGDSSYWDGVIDEFYIYDRALNDYQVEQLYAAASVDGEQYPFTATASAPVIEYTNLTAVNVSVNDSSPIEGDVISYTTTITPSNATNVTYFVDFGDGTNSTSANGTHTYTTAGSYNLSVNATDSQNNVFTSTAPITVQTSVTVENLTIDPALNISAFGLYTIRANVTNGTALDNVTLVYSAENTFGECDDYSADGVCRNTTYTRNMTYNSTSGLWEFKTVSPDAIYPEIYFVDSATSWTNAPLDISIDRNQYHLFNFTIPVTFTNETAFFIEIGAEPKSLTQSVPLDVYLINNSVTDPSFFQTDWRNDPRVVLVESIDRNTPYSHTHTENSSHYLVRLSTDENKLIAGLNLSGNAYMAFVADTTASARGWNLKYYNSSLCTTTRWLTADSSPTWSAPVSAPAGCPDTHFHIVRVAEDGGDFVNATVTAYKDGAVASNTTQFYFANISNLAPNPSSIIAPPEDGWVSRLLNATYRLSWNEATDIDNDVLRYSMSLLYPNLTLEELIVANTTNLSYDWIIPVTVEDGPRVMELVVCDTEGLCTSNVHNVTFDSTAPALFGFELPAVSQDDTGTFTYIVLDDNMAGVTVSFRDPNGNALGPFALTNASSTYTYSYRFTIVGDYTDVTFTATDLAGNTLVTDGGSFFISNPDTTVSTPTGGGGGGGTSGITNNTNTTAPTVDVDAQGLASIDAEPRELRLTFYQKSGRLYLENLGLDEETFTILAVNTKLQDRITFEGERIGLIKIPGRASAERNSAILRYDVNDDNLSDGRYVVTFSVANSKGQVVAVDTVDIVKLTTVVDEVSEILSREVVPPITGMGINVPSISYFGAIAILSSFLVAGAIIRSTVKVRVRRRKKNLEGEELE